MIYLNTENVNSIYRDWNILISLIEDTVKIMGDEDFAQPIKPYLRYRNSNNRIIAMPAFIGGNINVSGIKWIASFPSNIEIGLKRANSITILNKADTGIPFCIINTSLISSIRTASVTGLMIQKYLGFKDNKKSFIIGLSGFGPIGQTHLEMVSFLMKDRIKEVRIFDVKSVDVSKIPDEIKDRVIVCNTFENTFEDADIYITSTVSKERYIIQKPKKGSLHLNVSLRDYDSSFRNYVNKIIVDDWDEVCRENTDIENMYLNEGLKKEHTLSLIDIFSNNLWDSLEEEEIVMFNPMGMAVFDIAIAKFFCEAAQSNKVGWLLDD